MGTLEVDIGRLTGVGRQNRVSWSKFRPGTSGSILAPDATLTLQQDAGRYKSWQELEDHLRGLLGGELQANILVTGEYQRVVECGGWSVPVFQFNDWVLDQITDAWGQTYIDDQPVAVPEELSKREEQTTIMSLDHKRAIEEGRGEGALRAKGAAFAIKTGVINSLGSRIGDFEVFRDGRWRNRVADEMHILNVYYGDDGRGQLIEVHCDRKQRFANRKLLLQRTSAFVGVRFGRRTTPARGPDGWDGIGAGVCAHLLVREDSRFADTWLGAGRHATCEGLPLNHC